MDEQSTRDLFEGEIRSQIEDLSSLNAGSEEKSRAIDDLAKLYRLRIEESKAEWDADEKYNRRMMEAEQNETENALKEKQLEADTELRNCQIEAEDYQKTNQLAEQVKDRYFKLGIEAAGIVLPLIFYATWMRRGFKFEETGTYTSTTFRGLFNRFKPTKK